MSSLPQPEPATSAKFVSFSAETRGGGGGASEPTSGDEDVTSNKLPRSQTNSNATASSSSTAFGKSSLPYPSKSTGGRSSTAGGGSGGNNNWLGTQNTPLSPKSTPPLEHKPPLPSSQPATEGHSSEEENELFRDFGLDRQGLGAVKQRSGMNPSQKPTGNPVASVNRSRSRMTLGESATPPLGPFGEHVISSGQAQSQQKPFSSTKFDQLGASPPGGSSPKPSMEYMKSQRPFPPQPTIQNQQPPLPSSDLLLGQLDPPFFEQLITPKPSTIHHKLPSAAAIQGFSLVAQPSINHDVNPGTVPAPPGGGQPIKKKIVKGSAGGGGVGITPSNTLQLPSHLINEEELKTMSASLKTLYANQLTMLEKSYQEQMSFLCESNKRKEEMLKEEMKAMQVDYEERLERLKEEVRELESKQSAKVTSQQDLTALANLSQQLNTGIVTLRDVLQKSKEGAPANSAQVQQLLQQSQKASEEKLTGMEGKLFGMVKAVDESVAKRFSMMNEAWKNLCVQNKQNLTEVLSTARASDNGQPAQVAALAKLEGQLDGILGAVDSVKNCVGASDDSSPKLFKRIDDSEKLLVGEMVKILKVQRRVKESTDKFDLEPLVKVLESSTDDETRRREKLALQIKEMRRDLKKILIENESRQESLQKSSIVVESELKSVSQSIRDLNSQLKFSFASGPTDNLTKQFNTSMQQTQAEMEMKLLREERQALSDSMAQINVEKRKMSEEKIHLEKQKLDFQKQQDNLKNLEIQVKTKLEETEHIQKKTEAIRKEEVELTAEAQVQLRDLDRERSVLRAKLSEAEQKLKMWELKLRSEKVELIREREFVEKLRDQMLCPGCMKHNESSGGMHPPPPPYIDITATSSSPMLIPPPSTSLNLNGEYLFNKTESDFLDVYYRKLFD